MTLIIAIAAFVGVAAAVIGVTMIFRGGSGSVAEDRLDVLTSGGGRGTPKGDAPAEGSLLAHPLDDRPNFAELLLSRFGSFSNFLEQADAPLNATTFLIVTLAFAGAGAAVSIVLKAPIIAAPIAAAALAPLPLLWLWFRRKRRLAMFGKQLPEALELISRALRAGHSLGAGMSLVADEMADPIRKEFNRCYEEQNLGIPLDEALEGMTERVPNLDLRFFATAVILQRQTGGDLAEILDKIGKLIRERFKIWGQIQALTGEGRLSGIVLLALPPVLFITMYRLNPEYCMILFRDELGHKMLAGAAVMQVLGALVIRKIVNIKV